MPDTNDQNETLEKLGAEFFGQKLEVYLDEGKWEPFPSPPSPKPTDFSKDRIKDATTALKGCCQRILRHPWVTAVDVGYFRKGMAFHRPKEDHKEEIAPAIRIHLKEKLDPGLLHEKGLLEFNPKGFRFALPGSPSIPIDLIPAVYGPNEISEECLEAQDARFDCRQQVNPLVGGISIGNSHGSAGTLGAIVWDKTDRTPCILTNWHVLAGQPEITVGERCLQPAAHDGGRPDLDCVATLKRWRLDKHMDAALAQLTGARQYAIGDVLAPKEKTDRKPGEEELCAQTWRLYDVIEDDTGLLGLEVMKYSRSSEATLGFIDGVSLAVKIKYAWTNQTFEGQLHIVALDSAKGIASEVGDSGVIWTKTWGSKAVGLHFAGETLESPLPDFAIASPLHTVVEKLQISFTPVFDLHKDARKRCEEKAEPTEELGERLRKLEKRVFEGATVSTGAGPGGPPLHSGGGGG